MFESDEAAAHYYDCPIPQKGEEKYSLLLAEWQNENLTTLKDILIYYARLKVLFSS